MNRDRRRAGRDRREALRVPAVFAVKSRVKSRIQLGQAEDIGPAGMTLRRPKDVPFGQGTTVVLTFALPGGDDLLAVTGVVVSDRLAGSFRRTGIRFAALAAETEQRLQHFCDDSTGLTYAVRVA
jgi:hypothetical protein